MNAVPRVKMECEDGLGLILPADVWIYRQSCLGGPWGYWLVGLCAVGDGVRPDYPDGPAHTIRTITWLPPTRRRSRRGKP